MSISRVLELPITCDTYIDANAATTNFGTGASMGLGVIYASGSKIHRYRIVLRTVIPSWLTSAAVGTAGLYLNCTLGADSGYTCSVNRITSSGSTGYHEEAQETWNNRLTSTAWTAAGGDYTATGAVTFGMPTGSGYLYISAMRDLVRDAIDSRSYVLDLLLFLNSESPGKSEYCVFYTRESGSGFHPYVSIEYTDNEMDTGAII